MHEGMGKTKEEVEHYFGQDKPVVSPVAPVTPEENQKKNWTVSELKQQIADILEAQKKVTIAHDVYGTAVDDLPTDVQSLAQQDIASLQVYLAILEAQQQKKKKSLFQKAALFLHL